MSTVDVVFGYYSSPARSARRTEADRIREICLSRSMPMPLKILSSSCDAAASALMRRKRSDKEKIIIIGCSGAITPPGHVHEESVRTHWARALSFLLRQEAIELLLYDELDGAPTVPDDFSAFEEAFFSVRKQLKLRTNHIRKTANDRGKIYRTPNACRPPYGYVRVEGNIMVDPIKVGIIRFIFEEVCAGKSKTSIAANLRDPSVVKRLCEIDAGFRPGAPEVQRLSKFWDSTKICRILSNARLYCRGHYHQSEGVPPQYLPELAILPAPLADHPSLKDHIS